MKRALLILMIAACGGGPDPHKHVAGPFLPALDPAERCADAGACKQACDRDDLRACEDLGTRLAHGAGGAVAPADAAPLLERACTKGRGSACAALGLLFQDGRGVGESDDRAAHLYEDACHGGAGVGCFDLALMIEEGPLAYDPAQLDALLRKSEALYTQACDGGDLTWCINLGVLYENGMIGKPDPRRAADAYRRACYGGVAEACANLALILLQQPASAAFAEKLLAHACDAGSAVGCGALGQAYTQGHGVAADATKGVALLRKGCDGGDADACGVLGAVLALGEKVPPDAKGGHDAEQRACEIGASLGCMAVAAEAEGTSDLAGAARGYERACAIGDGEGCFRLGLMRREGKAQPATDHAADGAALEACRLHYHPGCIVLLARGEDVPVPPEDVPSLRAEGCQAGIKQLCSP